MKLPYPFRAKAPMRDAALVASTPPRASVVVEGLVQVASNGAAHFICNLKPEELRPSSATFASWINEKDRADFGILPTEAFSGVLLHREPGRPNVFVANMAFFEFMQFAVASIGPHLPSLQAAAHEAQRTGGLNIFVYDGRIDKWLHDHPNIMPNDKEALGCFKVHDGKITTESYLRNTKYDRWTTDGPTRIPLAFYDAFLHRLRHRKGTDA